MDSITFFLQSFISLFVIVNAIGNVPLFVTLLERFGEAEKTAMMKKASIVAALTLLIVTVTGNLFFRLLGIEMFSFTIAGGVLLMIISIEMLLGLRTRTQSSMDEEKNSSEMDEITVIPLAIPLLTGPGALPYGGEHSKQNNLDGYYRPRFCNLIHNTFKIKTHPYLPWKNRYQGSEENNGPHVAIDSCSIHHKGHFRCRPFVQAIEDKVSIFLFRQNASGNQREMRLLP